MQVYLDILSDWTSSQIDVGKVTKLHVIFNDDIYGRARK